VLCGVLLLYGACFLFLGLFNMRESNFNYEYEGRLLVRVHMQPHSIFWVANISILPIGLFSGSVSFLFAAGCFGATALMAAQGVAWRLKVLIPDTGISLAELDQAVTLFGGFVAFAFSFRDAFVRILQIISDRNAKLEERIEAVELELMDPDRDFLQGILRVLEVGEV